jgi:hypothetical protein
MAISGSMGFAFAAVGNPNKAGKAFSPPSVSHGSNPVWRHNIQPATVESTSGSHLSCKSHEFRAGDHRPPIQSVSRCGTPVRMAAKGRLRPISPLNANSSDGSQAALRTGYKA